MNKRNYQLLVVATIALPLIGFIAERVFGLVPEELSAPFNKYVMASEVGTRDAVMAVFGILLLIGFIRAAYGLLRFRCWAPRFNLWVTALGMLFGLFLGPVLQSALLSNMAMLSCTLYGWILSMAFYSPEVREMFRSNGE